MKRDDDPEVIADERRQSETLRDQSRSRGEGIYGWRRPVLVAEWLCRRCGVERVGVTAEAVDALRTSNRELTRRGEPEIPTHRVVFCATCEPLARAERVAREQARDAEVARITRELREIVDHPDREAELVRELRELGHPGIAQLLADVREFRRARAASRGAANSRRKVL